MSTETETLKKERNFGTEEYTNSIQIFSRQAKQQT